MFGSFNSVAHPPVVLEEIERIQRDFLSQVGPNAPEQTQEFIDGLMANAVEHNTEAAMQILKALRITKYQNPVYQREIGSVSKFVVDCFDQYQQPEGISLDSDHLSIVPFATIMAPAMTGFVLHLDVLGLEQPKLPCIFLSQHCMQTAFICDQIHHQLRELVTESIWKRNLEKREFELEFDVQSAESLASIAIETLKAFLCDGAASNAGRYFDADSNQIESCRLLISYMIAHEYSHICLQHRARRNDDTMLALSSFRLRDLSDVTESLSQQQRLRIPINPQRLKYFFGHQQDELEADLLALMVIYSRLRQEGGSEYLLKRFFRQVCYSIWWSEINEVIGRTCLHGREWFDEPLHRPEFSVLSDLAWRNRYPSAQSRVNYLYDRARHALSEEHLEMFRSELIEADLLFTLWRRVIVGGAPVLASMLRDYGAESRAVSTSFVWKGMPTSVKGSVGYNDQTEAFRVYSWQDHLHVL